MKRYSMPGVFGLPGYFLKKNIIDIGEIK